MAHSVTARTARTRHGVTFFVPTSDLTDEIRSPMLGEVDREIRPRLRGQRGRALRTVARVRDRAAGAIRVPRRSAFLLAPPGPYGPDGAACAGSGSLWCRLESSLAYLSCFATLRVYQEVWLAHSTQSGSLEQQKGVCGSYRTKSLPPEAQLQRGPPSFFSFFFNFE